MTRIKLAWIAALILICNVACSQRIATSPTEVTPKAAPSPTAGARAIGTAASRIYLPFVNRAPQTPPPTAPIPTAIPTAFPTAIIPTTDIPVNLGGLHVEGVGDHTGYEEFLRACSAANRPVALIKVYGDGYSAKLAKTIDPRTVTIWRKPAKTGRGEDADNPDGDWNWPESATAEVARRWMEAMYPVWANQREFIDYFEIVNEPNPATITQTLRATDFMIEAMKLAERHDPPYKLAIWSFSSGTPEPWQATIMLPSLRYAAEHGHILAVHDGSVNPNRPLFRQAYQDGTALRYRMFQSMLGKDMPRVAITEAYQPGSHIYPDWFDWQWYLTELAKDDVIGAAWFTLGPYSFGPGGDVNVVRQLPSFAQVLGCR